MKLTQVQRRTLHKLQGGRWICAYDLQESLGTLDALRRRNLVISREDAGAFSFPRTGIEWQITEHGKAALQEVPA